jgi:transposase
MTVTESHFAYRIDRWDANGDSVVKRLADIDDLLVARATYEAACKRWPGERITVRQETRVIEDSRKARVTRLHE